MDDVITQTWQLTAHSSSGQKVTIWLPCTVNQQSGGHAGELVRQLPIILCSPLLQNSSAMHLHK